MQRLAFITDISGSPQVWQAALPEAPSPPPWPDQLTFDADRVAGCEFSPAPGDGRLIYACDLGGNENWQLVLLSADEGSEVNLTAGYERAMHVPGGWSDDGTRILFAANRRHPGRFDLYVCLVEGEARMVWQNDEPSHLTNASFSPDGCRAIVTRMASSFQHDLFEVDLGTGTAQRLVETAERVRFAQAWYGPDGRSLYINTDLDSDFLYIARLDLESGGIETVVAPGWDCMHLTRSRDGTKLAYGVNVEGAHEVYVRDLQTGETQRAPLSGLGPGVIAGERLTFSPDGTRLAFAYTSATRTSDIYLWDLEHDRVRAVTRSSHGGLPVDSFVAPELVRYPTFDHDESGETRQIPAWFYKPTGASGRPLPVVVVVHGGPEGQYSPAFQPVLQYFLHNGYAVLAPNVRGSTGYGKAYSHLDDVEKRMDSVADLAHAVYWLREQGEIDGERIAVYGGSYGGFMVLSAITTYPDLWAAGVDIVGISNLATFLENTSEYRRAHREAEYGSLARDRAFLERIAPIHHVDQIVAPLMVIHGANDPRVPLSEAEQLVDALRAQGTPVTFLVFDDEGHGIAKLVNKLAAYPAIVEFLGEHLGEE
jgi:dipeptidyl aminopeptidase/acylaminoacyl peptidase